MNALRMAFAGLPASLGELPVSALLGRLAPGAADRVGEVVDGLDAPTVGMLATHARWLELALDAPDAEALAAAVEALRPLPEPPELARLRALPGRILLPELPQTGKTWLARQAPMPSVGELMSAPPEVAAVARGFLERAAQQLARGLEEERARRPLRAARPELAELFERVAQARAALREEASPLPSRAMSTALQADPPTLVARPPLTAWCGGGRLSPEVRLRLDSGAAACDCPVEGRGRCGVVLAVMDRALEELSDPERSRAWLDMELRPSWARALEQIDGLLAPPPEPMGWLLTASGRQWTVDPVKQVRGKLVRLSAAELGRRALDPADRAVLELVGQGWAADGARLYGALDRLVGHPRVWLQEGRSHRPLEVVRRELGLELLPDGDGLRVRATVPELEELARQPTHAGRVAWLLEEEGRLELVAVSPEALRAARALDGTRWPPEVAEQLLDRVEALGKLAPVHVDAMVAGRPVPRDERLLLRLEARPGSGAREAGTAAAVPSGPALILRVLLRALPEAPAYVPGEGPETVAARRAGRRVFTQRRRAGEPAWALERLEGLELPPPVEEWSWKLEGAEPVLGLLERLALRDDLEVEWAGSPLHTGRAAPRDLRVQVTEGKDWLRLGGRLEKDADVVPLTELLTAAREGRRWVAAAPDRWLALSHEFMRQLRQVEAMLDEDRIHPLLSPALEELAQAGVTLEGSRAWMALRDRVRAAADAQVEPPSGLTLPLRPYQVEGFAWMARLARWGAGGVLADDMGLGKTIQALALLLHRAPLGAALVVAPTSVTLNWAEEARRLAPGLELRRAGPGSLPELGPGQVLVLSYDRLLRDAPTQRFSTLILDEAQALKNAATRRAQAVRRLQADLRVALSGTPVENRSADLWSLMEAVVPGLLGSWDHFRGAFAIPIERWGDTERRAALARRVRPFILRRTKEEVAPELPSRTEVVERIELSPGERELYDQFRASALAELGAAEGEPQQTRIRILAAITRLRQLACAPRLVDPTSTLPSSKLERLVELCVELRDAGHRSLVFSQFTSQLDLAQAALEEAGLALERLDGSTPSPARLAAVQRFQAGSADAFLLSLKAGGTGLNLTAADHVIILDPWWNPAVEAQAADRAHRIGQSRPVTVHRLVSVGTVEEGIIALHASKKELVDALLEGTGAAASLGADDLLALIRDTI